MAVFISQSGYRLETDNEAVIEMMRGSGYREVTDATEQNGDTTEKATRKRKTSK